jgi:hypothetical protein
VVSRAKSSIAYKETYLLIINANIRRALFLGEVVAVIEIQIARRPFARSATSLAAA